MPQHIDAWGTYFEAEEKRRQSSGLDIMEEVWCRFLFRKFVQDMEGKVVVDVGCGPAWYVSKVLNPPEFPLHYIGIDSSERALSKASLNMPNGTFVKADVHGLPIAERSADFVLCLGVLMYFDDYLSIAESLVSMLKPAGRLLLHEQLARPPMWFRRDRSRAPTLGEAPSPKVVEVTRLIGVLGGLGTIEELHLSGSPLRTMLLALVPASLRNETSTAIIVIDELWCRVFGKFLPSVGPGHVQLVFRRDSPPPKGAAPG